MTRREIAAFAASRRITATSAELSAFCSAGPLLTSQTSPQPMMPQRMVFILKIERAEGAKTQRNIQKSSRRCGLFLSAQSVQRQKSANGFGIANFATIYERQQFFQRFDDEFDVFVFFRLGAHQFEVFTQKPHIISVE
jgi:hypothetical protein